MRMCPRILATGGAIIISAALSGCSEWNEPIPKIPETLEGTVKEEFGTAQGIVKSSGALFGNESVKIGDFVYGLVLETHKGVYTLSVIPYQKSVYALAKAIEPGDKVRITYDDYTHIGNDRIGETYSDTIELIEKAKK